MNKMLLPFASFLAILLPTLTQAQQISDGLWTYTLNASSEATVVAYSGVGGDVSIPAVLGGHPVKAVGVNWPPVFGFGNTSVTSLTIPDSVSSIGSYAFYACNGLTAVTVGNGLAVIGDYAFSNCPLLVTVTFWGNVPSAVGSGVLYQTTATVRYLSTATGWGATFAGRPTAAYVLDGDNDGVNDYRENADGTDPSDPNSFNPLSKGLLAYYPLNGSTNDESGFTRSLNLAGATQYVADRLSNGSSALSFRSTAPGLQASGSGVNLAGSSLTVSFWYLKESEPVDSWVFYIGSEGGSGKSVHVTLDYPADVRFSFFYNDLDYYSSPSQVANRWYHVIGTYDAVSRARKLFIDGVQVASDTPPVGFSGNDIFGFGKLGTSIDEVRIYNRALTATEVGGLYQAEAGDLDSDSDGLTDAWERGFGRYQIIQGNFNWAQANADAHSRGGHLATITSQAEQDFVVSSFEASLREGRDGTWFGAYQTTKANEPSGNWAWVTGESWSFTRWNGTPDNFQGNQDYGYIIGDNAGFSNWDDASLDGGYTRYLLEFGYPTDPLDPDSDDDGFNDKVESDAGSDPNNASAVPGFADTDGDGVNNFRENADGTNPNDANSFNPLSKGLVAFYPFANSLDDFSGYQNNFGTNFTGISFAAGRTGSGNTSVEFKDADASAVSRKNIGIAGNQKHAFSFWFYTPSTPSWPQGEGAVVTMGTGNGYGKISQIFIDDVTSGRIVAQGGYADLEKLSMGNAFAGRWNHVVFVYTGSVEASAIYLNGRQLSATPWSGGNRSNFRDLEDAPLLLGRTPSQVSHLKAVPGGRVSDLRVYSRELSSAEVMALYAYEAGNLDSDGDGLIDVHETNTGTYVSPTDTGSDLFIPDSDNDGFNDGVEVDAGSDPNNASSVPGFADSDGDGVNNYRENADGTNPNDANSFNLLSKGLVAYYPFDGSANDESGYANHGTAYESQSSADRFGLPAKAWRFNASSHSSNSRVVIPKAEQHNFQNELTVSLWARFNEPWSYKVEHLIWNRPAYQNYGWGMAFNQDDSAYGSEKYNGGGFGVVTSGGGLEKVNNSTAWSFGQMSHWRHYLAVFGGGRLKIYVDGVLVGDRAINGQILNGPADLIIGGCDNSPYANNRDVDDVRVYKRALSATEVEHLYLSEVAVVYVDAAATGAGDGSSWQDAYTDLQTALAAAQPGSQIWVAKGTYKPSGTGDRNASFALKSAVSLYGGFAGMETSLQQRSVTANPTILSGDLLGNDSATLAYSEPTRSDNSFHVIEALNVTSTAVLDGFVVKGGHANQGLSGADSVGSCIYVEGSNLTIRNCVFRDTFGVKGPSIYDMGGGNISIESCTFKGNKAFSVGSVHLASDFLIKDSAFVGNSASDSPYGYQWGGALFIVDVTGSVVNSVFADNYAAEDGGAVYSHGNTTFVNCTFSGNESATTGTAVMDRQKEAVFQNCIFWGNSGGQGLVGLPGAGLVIASADPYGGPASIGLGGPVKNSIVQGGYTAPGSANVSSADPHFYAAPNPLGPDGLVGTSDDGLRVMGWSPALEAGDNSFVPVGITTDIAGAPRIVGTVDLGAYEGPKILDPTGDEDGDGILNGAETNTGIYASASDTGTNPLKPDTDGDGLNDGVETNTGTFASASNTGTNPLAADTNADGVTDGEAVTWNFNPLINLTPIFDFVRHATGQTGGRFGLYTSTSIMDLRMGGLMIQKQGTNATISFQPQTTTDLSLPFTNNGTPISHQIPMPGDKGFVRIQAVPEPAPTPLPPPPYEPPL